jgi:hypothetical protein
MNSNRPTSRLRHAASMLARLFVRKKGLKTSRRTRAENRGAAALRAVTHIGTSSVSGK